MAAGSPLGFLITVTNTGGTASGTSLSATLPTDSDLTWAIDFSAGGGTTAAGCVIGGGVLSCSHGDLPPAGEVHVRVISTPPTGTDPLQVFTVDATVTASNLPTGCQVCVPGLPPECGTCKATASIAVVRNGNITVTVKRKH